MIFGFLPVQHVPAALMQRWSNHLPKSGFGAGVARHVRAEDNMCRLSFRTLLGAYVLSSLFAPSGEFVGKSVAGRAVEYAPKRLLARVS
jgi:hypothetical protein